MFKNKIKKIFEKYAYQAVVYAEDYIGGGHGQEKKQLAVDFLISKLPIYLKPFAPIFKTILEQIADTIIEKAVGMLHSVQQQQKERIEKQNG